MDNRPIGVFDSGLGGLTVVRRLTALLPHENLVYFGDTGRVPYGSRSPETIARYARQDCDFLLNQDVKFLIAACGTVSSIAADLLKALPVPAMGVVEATADAALAATRNGRIAVLGTTATIRSGSFTQYMQRRRPDISIFPQACPVLVSLVENGWIAEDNASTVAAAQRYLRPLTEERVDTVILGCTHFPLLTPIFSRILGDEVALIDSGSACAARCAQELEAGGRLTSRTQKGDCRFFVSDQPQNFTRVAEMFLGHPVGSEIRQVGGEWLNG